MGIDAGTPPGLWEKVRKIAAEEVAKFMRSGFLRNASISDGGLTIKGGFLRLLAKAGGVSTFYVGGVNPPLPDGTYQPGMILRRNDGTVALALYDPSPNPGDFAQFLGWFDRQGHVVMSDDTDSGMGHARPWLAHAAYASRAQDFPSCTASSWETIYRARLSKQQARLYAEAWAWTDAAGTTGEVRVLVGGEQFGDVRPADNALVRGHFFGPAVIPGEYGETLSVEFQARRLAGTGGVRLGAAWVEGRQS